MPGGRVGVGDRLGDAAGRVQAGAGVGLAVQVPVEPGGEVAGGVQRLVHGAVPRPSGVRELEAGGPRIEPVGLARSRAVSHM